MECYSCGHELIIGGDHDLDDDEDHCLVTNMSCPECDSFLIFYHSKGN